MIFYPIKMLFILITALWLTGTPCHAQPRKTLEQRLNLVVGKYEFAQELQTTFGTAATKQILATAEAQLARARELLSANRPILANQRLNEAERSIDQVMRLLLKEPLRLRRESLEQKIQLATELIQQTEDPQAQDWLDRGIRQKKLAEQAFRSAEFQQAIRHFRRAEFLVQRALEVAMQKDRSNEARADLEEQTLTQLLEQSRSSFASDPRSQVQRNYRQILKLIARAREARARGDFSSAIELYHQATRLVHRTRDLAAGKTDRMADRAFDELNTLDELTETLQARLSRYQDDEWIEFFMSHLKQVQQAAHRAMEQQDYQRVLLNTELGRNLIEQIQTKMRERFTVGTQSIQQELDELERELNQLNQNLLSSGDNEQARRLLMYSQSAQANAEDLFQKQDYQFARHYIFIARRLANAADLLLVAPSVDALPCDSVRNKFQDIEKDLAGLATKGKPGSSKEAQFYFELAQRFLNLAKENLEQNHCYVSQQWLDLSHIALNRLKGIL